MAVRKEHSFFECCQTPELAAELTLQPIRRYSGLLDAAIIFCDMYVESVFELLGGQVDAGSAEEPFSILALVRGGLGSLLWVGKRLGKDRRLA